MMIQTLSSIRRSPQVLFLVPLTLLLLSCVEEDNSTNVPAPGQESMTLGTTDPLTVSTLPMDSTRTDFVKDSLEFEENEEVLTVAEKMPHFAGCEDQSSDYIRQNCAERKMMKFVAENLNYPSKARESGVEGTAIVQFVVEKDGRLSGIKVARDPGAGLGDEARRIVEAMPNWSSGEHQGRAVRVQYTLPIRFRL